MFRNQYDSDVTTWSPQGRIHQVEYAMEAVKQGAVAVGLKSKTHVVLLALKRSSGELSSYQKKIFKLDDHLGIAIAGLSSDARVLKMYMRSEALNSKVVYNRPIPIGRLVTSVGDKAQVNTQQYGSRPYGVGLLVAGCDDAGTHLYECSPSGNVYDFIANAIGARSQSAKTYLEKTFDSYENAPIDDLILHGLRALRDSLQSDTALSTENCSISVVGLDSNFSNYSAQAVSKYLDVLKQEGGLNGRQDESMQVDVAATATETTAPPPAAAAPPTGGETMEMD